MLNQFFGSLYELHLLLGMDLTMMHMKWGYFAFSGGFTLTLRFPSDKGAIERRYANPQLDRDCTLECSHLGSNYPILAHGCQSLHSLHYRKEVLLKEPELFCPSMTGAYTNLFTSKVLFLPLS